LTEDELFFAVDTVRDELRKARETHRQHSAYLEAQAKMVDRNEQIRKSLVDALNHLFTCPVVSIGEYRSLTDGLRNINRQLGDLQEKRTQSLKKRNQAALEIPKLEAQLVDLELQWDRYAPPRVVLEFKRNDKQ
jgi:K+-sensing histidine kinase KdpD